MRNETEKYITDAASGIRSRIRRRQFERELRSHIADLTDHYVEIGYDPDAAEDRALKEMGDAERLSIGMKKVYSAVVDGILAVAAFILPLGAYVLFDFFDSWHDGTLVFKEENTDYIYFEVISLVIIPIVFLILTILKRGFFLRFSFFSFSAVYTVLRIIRGRWYSLLLFDGWLVLSGRAEEFGRKNYIALYFDNQLLAVCTGFLIFFILSSELMLLLVTMIPSKHNVKRRSSLRSVFSYALVLSAVISGVFVISDAAVPERSGDKIPFCAGYAIYETDKPIDSKTIDLKEPTYTDYFDAGLFRDFPNPTLNGWTEIETGWVESGIRGVKLGMAWFDEEIKVSKRYITVVSFNNDEELNRQSAQCFDTRKEDEVSYWLNWFVPFELRLRIARK